MHCVKIDLHLFYFLSYSPLEFEFAKKKREKFASKKINKNDLQNSKTKNAPTRVKFHVNQNLISHFLFLFSLPFHLLCRFASLNWSNVTKIVLALKLKG